MVHLILKIHFLASYFTLEYNILTDTPIIDRRGRRKIGNLHPWQHAYRAGWLTETALHQLVDLIRNTIEIL